MQLSSAGRCWRSSSLLLTAKNWLQILKVYMTETNCSWCHRNELLKSESRNDIYIYIYRRCIVGINLYHMKEEFIIFNLGCNIRKNYVLH